MQARDFNVNWCFELFGEEYRTAREPECVNVITFRADAISYNWNERSTVLFIYLFPPVVPLDWRFPYSHTG